MRTRAVKIDRRRQPMGGPGDDRCELGKTIGRRGDARDQMPAAACIEAMRAERVNCLRGRRRPGGDRGHGDGIAALGDGDLGKQPLNHRDRAGEPGHLTGQPRSRGFAERTLKLIVG